jgi:hypothetical protein
MLVVGSEAYLRDWIEVQDSKYRYSVSQDGGGERKNCVARASCLWGALEPRRKATHGCVGRDKESPVALYFFADVNLTRRAPERMLLATGTGCNRK